jgi:hypothetical protein
VQQAWSSAQLLEAQAPHLSCRGAQPSDPSIHTTLTENHQLLARSEEVPAECMPRCIWLLPPPESQLPTALLQAVGLPLLLTVCYTPEYSPRRNRLALDPLERAVLLLDPNDMDMGTDASRIRAEGDPAGWTCSSNR